MTNRGRLFALSTGMALSPDVLDRLRPQITRQLIDERLRLQEVQRRHIIVSDKDIAAAIHEIEARNRMPPGALQAEAAAPTGSGCARWWTRSACSSAGPGCCASSSATGGAITERTSRSSSSCWPQQVGQPEYRVGEIFIPVDDPANTADAQKFAETVISELRAGAPFAVVAAQFSQSQTALQGGDLGWVQPNQLDPEVARVVQEMPVGAISNPIQVPGGIVDRDPAGQARDRPRRGHDGVLRQVFLPFSSPLNPQAPTEQQRQALEQARRPSARSVHSCEAMEAAAKANNSPRPADPGEVRLGECQPAAVPPDARDLPTDRASQPLVASDGIAVVIVCSREQKNLAQLSKEEISNRMLSRAGGAALAPVAARPPPPGDDRRARAKVAGWTCRHARARAMAHRRRCARSSPGTGSTRGSRSASTSCSTAI